MRFAIDASSIIHAWEFYPIGQIPNYWDWVASQINKKKLVICEVALDEVKKSQPDCEQFLRSKNIETHPVTNDITQLAFQIKSLLGIVNDNFGKGVGENDILIIAHVWQFIKDNQCFTLITDENRQNKFPQVIRNYKIPAVCDYLKPEIPHQKWLDYFKDSNVKL